jgi:hypothetical protein
MGMLACWDAGGPSSSLSEFGQSAILIGLEHCRLPGSCVSGPSPALAQEGHVAASRKLKSSAECLAVVSKRGCLRHLHSCIDVLHVQVIVRNAARHRHDLSANWFLRQSEGHVASYTFRDAHPIFFIQNVIMKSVLVRTGMRTVSVF